jgi:predicted dehydrogenase
MQETPRCNNRTSRAITRRTFVQAGAATALTAATWRRAYGANERIGVGLIGYGLVGQVHARHVMAQPDARIVAVSDVYQPRLAAAAAAVGGPVAQHRDFRRLLDSKDVDALVVATPDHWHALMTMMGCAAGKDVYVEKPLNLFVREGRWMIDVARKHKRVVQVGTQARSGKHAQRAGEAIRAGKIGEIAGVEIIFCRNLSPGFGNPPDGPPPPELDWDLFLGPAPMRPYNPNRGIYHFRWFWDTAGGQMTNLGQHSLDTVYWLLGLKGPKSVTSVGGRYFLKDNCETPDVQDVILEYDRFTVFCQWRECAASAADANMGAVRFCGTRGTLPLTRDFFEIIPDKRENPVNVVGRIFGGHPVGGPQVVPEEPGVWTEPLKDNQTSFAEQYVGHVRNFLDCIKSREQPVADLESAHRVATACHLANISLRTGKKFFWDAEKEEIVGDPDASRMLVRPYRQPWDAELRALAIS